MAISSGLLALVFGLQLMAVKADREMTSRIPNNLLWEKYGWPIRSMDYWTTMTSPFIFLWMKQK